MDGVQDRRTVSADRRGRLSAVVKLAFRAGGAISILVFVGAVVGLIYLRFLAPPSSLSAREAWPTEGYYFAGAQYQLTLQALRLAISEHHLAASDQGRAARRRDVLVLRDVLHAKYSILMDSPELAPYLRTVPGFNAAVEPLTKFDSNLDAVVTDALQDPAGLTRFNSTVLPLYELVLGMVNDLRVAELGAFEAAFAAERRAATAYKEVGLALLAILGIGIFFHLHFRRKERHALRMEAKARAEAQRSAQARTALLGMVSHELRTPLQTMLADVELLAEDLPTHDTPAVAQTIERLERSIGLISGQLDNIAQYTRLASGKVETRRERFAVADLLRRIVDEHAAAAKENHQVLLLDVAEETETTIYGDPIRLHQVINNFISNAMKYAGPGAIGVNVHVYRGGSRSSHTSDMIEVGVVDKGPGIAAAEQEAIWEPFVRGGRGAGRRKGSGLGLAVAKLLATSAGWEVGVQSDVGEGALFYVRLPADEASTPHAISAPPQETSGNRSS